MTGDELVEKFVEVQLRKKEWSEGNWWDFFTGKIGQKIQPEKEAIMNKLTKMKELFDQMQKLSDEISETLGQKG